MQPDGSHDLESGETARRTPFADVGFLVLAVAEEHHLCTPLGMRIPDVDDADVHGDATDHRASALGDRDGDPVPESAEDTLRVSPGHEGDVRVLGCAVGQAVGHPLVGQQDLGGQNAPDERHRGP